MPDVLPQVHSSEDWQAAFGFPQNCQEEQVIHSALSQVEKGAFSALTILLFWQNGRDDDLGFDPFHETQKALAELIEKEEEPRYQQKLLMHHNNR